MKTILKTLTLTAGVLVALTSATVAAPAHPAKATSATKATSLICPVTGTKIASASKAYNHETYKGKTYYFCCPECKPAFDKNPKKIIANTAKGKYQPM